MSAFHDQPQTKLGDYGEQIVDAYLKAQGKERFRPAEENEPHKFDRVVDGKGGLFVLEVKTKCSRTEYPDTGFPITHDDRYLDAAKSRPVWVAFVDWEVGMVYWANLLDMHKDRELRDERGRVLVYPRKEHSIIYFPLCVMRDWFPLTPEQIAECRRLSGEVRAAA